MDLLSVGNLNRHMKQMKLQTQWKLKQESGSYTAKGTSLEEWLNNPQAQARRAASDEEKRANLRKIHQKLESGGKLTAEEKEYLQKHDPESYQELVNQEREQKAYEQALRRCSSQEEVERLRVNQLNSSLVKVRAVEHNANIGKAKKLEIIMREKQRVDRIAESTREFVASGEYAQLPTRREEIQADKDAVDKPAPAPEMPQAEGPKPEGEEEVKSPTRPEQDAEPEKIDVETPEERKVRRAKAKAAYAVAAQPPETPAADRMNVQA